MGNFLKEIKEYQEYLSGKHEDEQEVTWTYEQLSAVGLVKPSSFRLPVSLVAQLDEIYKFSPYGTKGQMVAVMLQDCIDAFLADSHESLKARFKEIEIDAMHKVTGNKPLSEFMKSNLTAEKLYGAFKDEETA